MILRFLVSVAVSLTSWCHC